mgnify:CR=1 FL=1
MGRSSIFDHPLLLGFEEIERTVGGLTKSAGDGYPPYNIEQTRPDALRITLAVVGFAEEQLSITIESRQLVVRCKQGAGGRERVFLRRGIAARQFQRSFVLANGIEVGGASLELPLLHIDMACPQVEALVRSVEITTEPDKTLAEVTVGG